jgi:hypothetical protein
MIGGPTEAVISPRMLQIIFGLTAQAADDLPSCLSRDSTRFGRSASVITLWCPEFELRHIGGLQPRATLSLFQWPADPLRPAHDATNFGGRAGH